MSTVFVAIAYILIVLLAVAVIRLFFVMATLSKSTDDMNMTRQEHARRIEQLASAINNIQAGLLNLSNGAQALLVADASVPASSTVRAWDVARNTASEVPIDSIQDSAQEDDSEPVAEAEPVVEEYRNVNQQNASTERKMRDLSSALARLKHLAR